MSAIAAARRGDLKAALAESRAMEGEAAVTDLAVALGELIQLWLESVKEKERVFGELLLAQAEVEETNDRLREEMEERERAQSQLAALQAELVQAARKAGMSEVAAGVLHNVGNVLNSINVSAFGLRDRLQRSKAERVLIAANRLRDHQADLARYLADDPKGRLLPDYLAETAKEQLERDQLLTREAESICSFVDHVSQIRSRTSSRRRRRSWPVPPASSPPIDAGSRRSNGGA